MILLPASLVLVAPLLLQGGPPGAFPRDWVVKELILPPMAAGRTGVVDTAIGFGDPLGRGYASWGRRQFISPPSETTTVLTGGQRLDDTLELAEPVGQQRLYLDWETTVLLASPSSPLIGGMTLFGSGAPAIWQMQPPALHGILTSTYLPTWFHRAGDLDGDGTDDFFYTGIFGNFSTVGAVSGATVTPLWERFSPVGGLHSTNLYVELGPPPDIDGDGVPDLVTGWHAPNFSLAVYEQYLVAFSGIDGSLIWSNNLGSQGPGFVATTTHGLDITGDGVGDAVFAGGHVVRAVDGATGTALWTVTDAMMLPFLPPTPGPVGPRESAIITGRAGEPGEHEIVATINAPNPGPITWLMHFDTATGQILHADAFPPDLSPWAPDLIQGAGYSFPISVTFSLGDLDRDGLKELAIKVRTPSNTPPGAPSANVSLAILGQKTLDVAPTVPLGGTLSVRVANPLAAGKAFSVLASDAFDAEGGLRLGGWRTHLAPSALLTHTLQAAPLSGVFDQDGLATVQVTIPSAPSWLGRTLYLKAVVRDTPTATEPYSMSTLGVVEVVP